MSIDSTGLLTLTVLLGHGVVPSCSSVAEYFQSDIEVYFDLPMVWS